MTHYTLVELCILGICGHFQFMKLLHLMFMTALCDFMSPGVKHSVLRQVAEGLLSVRSGAGAPVVKAVYRGGESHV